MHIKSIRIGNYKNLSDTTFEIDRMLAFVSTNNYGKSNLLEAIKFAFDFVSASTKQRTSLMSWGENIPLSPSLAGKDFIFVVEFEDDNLGKYRYVRYGFSFCWYNDKGTGARISDEILEMRETESVRYTSYLKRNESKYKASKSKNSFRKINLESNVLAIDILSALNDIEIVDVIKDIKHLGYRMCNTLELDKSYRQNPIELDIESVKELKFNDEDIPKALNILRKENPEQFEDFVEAVYELFPEFTNIELQSYTLNDKVLPQASTIVLTAYDSKKEQMDTQEIPYHIKDELYRLIITSKNLNQPISMEYMSTGTKRIIWLIANAIISGAYGVQILGVDEVETSIHPRMIKSLLEVLNEGLNASSLVITSHSPYLVQYMKPENIYIGVPNDKGIAMFKRIHHSKLKEIIAVSRSLETTVGEYLFELMAGDEDSAAILSAYLED